MSADDIAAVEEAISAAQQAIDFDQDVILEIAQVLLTVTERAMGVLRDVDDWTADERRLAAYILGVQ